MNYGKRIKLTFDRAVSHVSNKEITKWALKDMYGDYTYPVNITYGATNSEVYLDFADFNSIAEPCTLECLGCIEMGSNELPFDPSSSPIVLYNLWPVPCDNEYLGISDISFTGTLAVSFNGQLFEDEYLQLTPVFTATNLIVSFNNRYENEYLAMTVTMSGQYCDINGIPL